MRIAFCDDDISVLNDLRNFLDKYRVERNQKLDYIAFQSAFDLLAEIEKGTQFDIIFLDVLMPGVNGIDAATEIRNFDSNVKIIFLTSTSEFAVESYTVEAYFYQLKPIFEEDFFKLMDKVLSACENEQRNSLILRCKSGITQVKLRHVTYCEVMHRTLLIHLTDGSVLECTCSLDEFCKMLEPYDEFIRPHRSYLVNLEHIKHLSCQNITMSCMTKIPIPRGKYHEIKDTYLEYVFKNRQVVI